MHAPAIPVTPVLREGDRLDAEEFLRRWEAMPDLKFAELIDGVVHMASPISLDHGRPHSRVISWLDSYVDATPGCETASATTWRMAPRDVPQPDACLYVLPAYGGQSTEMGPYGAGAPELIVEVTNSTKAYDLGPKLALYRRAGVREYVTILPRSKRVSWRVLTGRAYRESGPGPDGLFRSHIFPGLWLDPASLWDRTSSVRTAVEQGTRTAEHAAFVRELAMRRAG